MDSVAFVDGLSAATGNAEEEKDDEETQHNGFSNVTVTYAPPEDGSGDAQPPRQRRPEEAGGAVEMDTATANQVEKKQDGEEETQQNGEAQPPHQRKPKLTISLNITRPIGLHRAVLLYPCLLCYLP